MVTDAKQPAQAVAVIDIGSNSVRMAIAQVPPEGPIEVLERTRKPVHLGHDTFRTGRLSRATINACVAVLRDYRRILDTYHVRQVRAVATSAVREAINADALLDRIFTALGLDVEVIEPSEESRLTVSAVLQSARDALDLRHGDMLIAEVGGGTALLTLLHKGEIAGSEAYRLGAIRLQETLPTMHEPPQRAADLLRHQIDNMVAVIQRSQPVRKVRCFVAVGGDARFAAAQVGKPADHAELHIVEGADLDRLVAECSSHSAEELSKLHGLAFSEAETLVPALLAYQALLRSTRAGRLVVSSVSMRDGLLLDLARLVRGEQDAGLEERIIASARSVGEKYRYDARHGEHVAYLACRLFDALQAEHGLSGWHRLLLRVSGVLHEVGGFVSNRSHHKHSYYLVANSTIYGLRKDDLAIVANVARYHRRSAPKPTHTEFMGLPRETRGVISKLAALLRVADALDRSHSQQVRDIQVEKRADELVIYVQGVPDLTLERSAMPAKADMFEDTYGLTVRLEEATTPLAETRRAKAME